MLEGTSPAFEIQLLQDDEMDYIGRKLQLFAGPDGVTVELVEVDA